MPAYIFCRYSVLLIAHICSSIWQTTAAIYCIFNPKNCLNSRKYDHWSGIFILDFLPIPDSGSRIQGSKRHRIPERYCPFKLSMGPCIIPLIPLCVCVNNFKGCGPGTLTTVLGIDLTAVYTMIKCKVYCVHYNNNISWKKHTSAFT